MRLENQNNTLLGILDVDDKITCIEDALDIMGNAHYNGCSVIIALKDCLDDSFFNLKTGFAGEVLQKFSNYNMKIAIIGDFSQYTSKNFHDFIYECNQGKQVAFKSTVDEGIDTLTHNQTSSN